MYPQERDDHPQALKPSAPLGPQTTAYLCTPERNGNRTSRSGNFGGGEGPWDAPPAAFLGSGAVSCFQRTPRLPPQNKFRFPLFLLGKHAGFLQTRGASFTHDFCPPHETGVLPPPFAPKRPLSNSTRDPGGIKANINQEGAMILEYQPSTE